MSHSAKLRKILSIILILALTASMLSLTACKNKNSTQGEPGIQGEKGETGAKGESGSTPYVGENGNWWIESLDTGVKATGNDGINGLPGKDGTDGVTPSFRFEENEKILYVSYDNGTTWSAMIDVNGLVVNGKDGVDGKDGEDGKDGVNGTNGENGADGKDGTDGINGITPLLKISAESNTWMVSYDNGESWTSLNTVATGKDGKDGVDGTNGKDGIDGTNGLDGKNGADGKDGINGENGADGVTPRLRINSDYIWEVSYDNGQNWESLGVRATGAAGEPGKDGTNSTNGKDGEDGKNGENGTTPLLQFENNKIYVSYDKGLNYSVLFDLSDVTVNGGENGENGKDGITPLIRINSEGIWEVSYDSGETWVSLGVSAVGKDGTNGSAGSSGSDGANGKDGKDGITPQLKIVDNVWMVSYDSGLSWISLGANAAGNDGSDGRGIKSMEIRDGYLYVTYTDSVEPVKLGAVGAVGGSGSAPEDSDYYTEGLAFYPLPDGTYGVKAGYTEYLNHIVIPAKYKGKAVTKILDGAFSGFTNLTSIVLPEGITEIGDKAFLGCENLESITIPNSVNVIGSSAFEMCFSITSIYIHKNVVTIKDSAFSYVPLVECEIKESEQPDTWEYFGADEIRWGVSQNS